MDSRSYCKLPITLHLTRIDVDAEGCVAAVCHTCGRPLDLHQPDNGHPDRLLGTCAACGGWHMIDVPVDQNEAYLVRLPDFQHLQSERNKLRKNAVTAHGQERGRRDLKAPETDPAHSLTNGDQRPRRFP